MVSKEITDLTILGIARQGPVNPHCLVASAKMLAPEFWQPTDDVIVMAIRRNLNLGHLRSLTAKKETNNLILSECGRSRLGELLLDDKSYENWPTTTTLEALQFCFLDSADMETAKTVLAGMKSRLVKRLANFEKCSYIYFGETRFSSPWVALERQRLENWAQKLSTISK